MTAPTRGLFLAACTFTFGILVGQYGPSSMIRLTITLSFFVATLVVLFNSTPQPLRSGFLLILWFLIGWSRSTPEVYPIIPEDRVWYVGTILLPIEHYEDRTRFRIKIDRWEAGEKGEKLSIKAVATIQENLKIEAGEEIRFIGIMNELCGPRNPGEFDTKSYWGMRGITHSIRSIREIDKIGCHTLINKTIRITGRIRDGISNLIKRDCDTETIPLAKALIIGDRTDWEESTRAQLARSGIMPFFAISGLHIGIISIIIGTLLSWIFPFWKRTRMVVLVLMIWILIPLTGGNPPVIRATVMISLIVLGRIFQRQTKIEYFLLVAYLLLLTWRSAGLYDAGFQLSFAGAFGSIYTSHYFKDLLSSGRRKYLPKHLRGAHKYSNRIVFAIAIAVGTCIATSPFLIYHFGRMPWFSPVTGVVASIIMVLALTSGWVMVFSAWLPWLSAIFGAALHGSIYTLEIISKFSAEFLPVSENLSTPAVFAAVLVTLIFGLYIKRISKQPFQHLPIPILLSSVIIVFASLWLPDQKVKLAVIDVGQGDGILLRRGDRVVLIDGGRAESHALKRQLQFKGIKKIDLLLLTHGDSDHCGAIPEIVKNVEIEAAIIGPGTLDDSAGLKAVKALLENGSVVYIGNSNTTVNLNLLGKLRIVSPSIDISNRENLSDNDKSLVVVWEVESLKALFPGDISSEIEKLIIDENQLGEIDLLIPAHHGSRFSTCLEWLDKLDPEIAPISCGRFNSYGHPSQIVLENLNRKKVEIYRTDLEGGVFFSPVEGRFKKIGWSSW
jgi:competence protein ComEC